MFKSLSDIITELGMASGRTGDMQRALAMVTAIEKDSHTAGVYKARYDYMVNQYQVQEALDSVLGASAPAVEEYDDLIDAKINSIKK